MNTIQSCWNEYLELNAPVPLWLREDLKRSFYAGAITMLDLVGRFSASDLSDESMKAAINGFYEEALDLCEGIDVQPNRVKRCVKNKV